MQTQLDPTSQPVDAGGRSRWAALVVVALATAMIILDSTVVAVALPTIIGSLSLNITTAEWVTTIYTVTFAALLIPTGQMVDRVGARRLLMSGITLFLVGSALAGIAPGGGELLFARLVQGMAGAMILPASLATLTALFSDRFRPAAFGIWGAVIGGMAAFGPLVGGWLTTNAGWRWVFFVNLPIAVVLVVAALFVMPSGVQRRDTEPFDVGGAVLVALTLAAVTFALVQGERFGWLISIRATQLGSITWATGMLSESAVGFIVAIACGGAFWLSESKKRAAGKRTYLAWHLFELRGFRYGNIAGAGVNFGEVGLVFILPLFLQAVLGLSAWDTGLVLAAVAGGAFLGGPIAGEIARRRGERFVVLGGIVILMVAIGGAARVINPTITGAGLAPWLGLAGIGIGAVQAQLSNIILFGVSDQDAGQASGTQSTFRQLGATFGVALIGTVLTLTLTARAADALAAAPAVPQAQATQITESLAASGGTALAGLRHNPQLTPVIGSLDDGFAVAVQRSMLVALAGFAVALGAAIALPESDERERAA
jgi:EmrB/QacA subfamily drug resistance transporter